MVMYHDFHKKNVRNKIKNIYTEDWSHDAKKLSLHHRDKLHFKIIQIENSTFEL